MEGKKEEEKRGEKRGEERLRERDLDFCFTNLCIHWLTCMYRPGIVPTALAYWDDAVTN